MTAKQAKIEKFGPSIQGNYPEEMRRQLWPLCCGASILSGFKNVQLLEPEELVQQIEDTIEAIPDLQVYGYEQIRPKLTFLTLNKGQMASEKIVNAVAKAGFVKFMEASPRGTEQGFYYRDETKTVVIFDNAG